MSKALSTKHILLTSGLIALLVGGVSVVAAFIEKDRISCDKSFMDNIGARTIYTDQTGKTQANWVDGELTTFKCDFATEEYGYRCGLDITFGNGSQNGIDLRNYSSIYLEMRYSGSSRFFRISFRDAFEDYQLAPEGKQSQIVLGLNNDLNKIHIPMSDFEVPHWWKERHPHIDKSLLESTRGNVTHVGLDIQTPMKTGTHEFKIVKFCAVKDTIASPAFIVLIALASISFPAALLLLVRYYQLKKRKQPSKNDIKILLHQFDELRTKEETQQNSDAYDPITRLVTREASIEAMNSYTLQRPIVGMTIVIIEATGYRSTEDDLQQVASPQSKITSSIAVKMHISDHDIPISWRDNRILILFPNASPAKIRKIIKRIHADTLRPQSFAEGESINFIWKVTQIKQSETFFQACERLERSL